MTITPVPLGTAHGDYLLDFGLACTGATMASAGAAAMLRRAVGRQAAERITLELIPSPTFAPRLEDVLRLAAGLTRSRRTRFDLGRAATCTRITLCSDPGAPGMLSYRITLPAVAIPQLQNALPSGVDLAEVHDPEPAEDEEPVVRRRLVMTLAHRDHRPLRLMPISPDPKEAFARVISGVGPGESVALVLDLMPLTHGQAAKWHRGLTAPDRQPPGNSGLGLHLLTQPLDQPRPASRGQRPAEARRLTKEETAKVSSPLFRTRIIAVAEAASPDRAEALVKQITDPLAAWRTPGQWLRASGHRVFGAFVGGADSVWRRRGFDSEYRSGVFTGHRSAPVISAAELSGLLVPPTESNGAGNLRRSGSSAAKAPPALLDYSTGDPDVLPLGVVRDGGRDRFVGVSRAETLFAYVAGASGAGKSQWAMNLAIHLATHKIGMLFVDPDQDAIEHLQHYLGGALADRVWVINLQPVRGELVLPGWNPLAVSNAESVEARVADVVGSFAAAGGWDGVRTPRAVSILEMAASSLCELGLLLRPEDCPTVFQVGTLINDEDWRKSVLPYLPPYLRAYWANTFAKESKDPTAAVTISRMIHRMWMSTGIRALLGSSVSTYDISAAMQRGDAILVCPAAAGQESTALLTNLLASNAVRAATARKSIAPADRREFWLVVDEAQELPPSIVAQVTEHGRKYAVHLVALNQTPERLRGDAWTALATNSSLLMASSMSAEGAARFTRKWGDDADPANLDLWTFLASTRIGPKFSDPFLVHGTLVRDVWGSRYRDSGPAEIGETIRRRPGLRPAAQVLADLDTLDARILAGLKRLGKGAEQLTPVRQPATPPPTGGAVRSKRRVPAAADQMGLGE